MRRANRSVADVCLGFEPEGPEPRRGPRPDAPGMERRRFPRIPVDRSATVTEMDEHGNPGPAWPCRVVNVSRGGLGVQSRRLVHSGRRILVKFAAAAGEPVKVLCGVVRHSEYTQGEGYAAGIEFQAAPASKAVQDWLARQGPLARLAPAARID